MAHLIKGCTIERVQIMKFQKLAQQQQDMVDNGTFVWCKLSRALRADEEGSTTSYSLGRYSCLILPETDTQDVWEEIYGRYSEDCENDGLSPRQYELISAKVVKGVTILNITAAAAA